MPFRTVRFFFCLGWAAAASLAAGAPRFVSDEELAQHVADLKAARLALMPEVAAYKFARHRPVTDPARERQVLADSVARAEAAHLDGAAARKVFAAQIREATAIEEACVARWSRGGGTPPPARDLVKELRPELDRIDHELLAALYLAVPSLRAAASPTWETVRRLGVLRVGTTGDYAPFSEERGGELQGVDIALAEELAGAWGVKAVFIRTSWPTLNQDLLAGRFDLAASGISVTAERARIGRYSLPYCYDGKTAIARRDRAARFASLAQIDQPEVRVIVNPGGTNERFVRERIHRAKILLHPDNRTIFDELLAGRADVMFTDSIEVRLQQQRHPELTATLPAPLTRTGKAWLFPAHSDLADRANAWLAARIARAPLLP